MIDKSNDIHVLDSKELTLLINSIEFGYQRH